MEHKFGPPPPGVISRVIFIGDAGVGKRTLMKNIVKTLEVPENNIFYRDEDSISKLKVTSLFNKNSNRFNDFDYMNLLKSVTVYNVEECPQVTLRIEVLNTIKLHDKFAVIKIDGTKTQSERYASNEDCQELFKIEEWYAEYAAYYRQVYLLQNESLISARQEKNKILQAEKINNILQMKEEEFLPKPLALTVPDIMDIKRDYFDICCIFFSLTRRESYYSLSKWIIWVTEYLGRNIFVIIIGTKRDAVLDRVVTTDEAENFASIYNVNYFEISSFHSIGEFSPKKIRERLGYYGLKVYEYKQKLTPTSINNAKTNGEENNIEKVELGLQTSGFEQKTKFDFKKLIIREEPSQIVSPQPEKCTITCSII